MKNVIIIGTGGHAKVIMDIVIQSGDKVLGFLSNDTGIREFAGKPIVGCDDDYVKFPDAYFIIAIGNARIRERISERMADALWYTAIHPTAIISMDNTAVGEGTAIMANAVINPYATIGRHCIINTSAIIEHDNKVSDFVHVSVGTKLAGTVNVGSRSWIGIGATVNNNVNICGDCMIGAGAVVIRDIDLPGTYVGVPARKIKP